MKCFARAHGGVSVVGDPDQSIYGWRSAEIENLNRMVKGDPRPAPSIQLIIRLSWLPGDLPRGEL